MDDADNAYSYMPDVSFQSSFIYGQESFKEEAKETIPGVYGAVGGLLSKAGKKIDKYFPNGIKLFNGAIDVKIGDELKSAGDTLVNMANRQIEIFEEDYKKKNPRLEKAQESIAFDIGNQSLNWGTMLLSGSVGAAGKAMGGLVLSGEFKERAEKYKQEHGGSLEGFSEEYSDDAMYNFANAYVQGVEEKYLGSWALTKSAMNGTGITKAVIKNMLVGGWITEPGQDVTDFYFDKVDGFNENEELKDRLKSNLRGYVVASIFEGAGGFVGALGQRSQGIDMYKEALKNTVPEEDLEKVATIAYERDAKTLKDVVVVEMENSSSLKNRRGKVFENMYNATLQAIREAKSQGAYQELETEDDIASYAQAESEKFADWTLSEANRRNTVLEEVIDAEKIAYKDGKLEIGMTEGTQEKTDIFEPIAERKTELPYDEIIHQLNTKEMSEEEEERLQEMLDEEKDRLKPLFDTALDVELEIEEDFDLVSELDDLSDSMLEDKVSYEDAKKKLYDFPEEQFKKLGDKIKERDGIDGDSAKIGYEYFTDKVFDKYNERVAESKNYRLLQESLDLANENARLDDIYPAYEGETITINGKERTVYNSNGDRIAKSKEALENFYKWFGDSKVVDKQGRPLVMYHNSGAPREVLSREYARTSIEIQGIFFAPQSDPYQEYGPYEHEVYLKIENPADWKTAYQEHGIKLGEREDSGIKVREWLQDKGYDGVMLYEDGKLYELIAFESNQIKSTSNRGTYSESENIYKQGEKGSIEFRGDKALINLTERADSTTFPHELAHYYLQNTFLYTKSGLASAEYMNNFNQIAQYLGITPDQETIKDWQQEKFARAYELYQMGNTPEGMEKPLTQYNQWLRKAYDGMQEPMYRDENGEMKVPEFDYDTMKMFASLAGETLTEPQFKENQERVRGLAKTTNEMAKQKGIETETPMYEPRSSTEMGKKADEFIKNNKQLAIDIVKGLAPEQDGLFRQDLFAALRELALNEGDSDLLNELSRSMTVEEATELGQRIQALSRGTVDPVRQMTELRDERMKKEKVTKEKVKEENKKATKEIKKEIALAAQPKEWQDFIKSLEC